MKRVFAYVRVSTEEQVIHGLSIEDQTAKLEAWVQGNGHKLVEIYTDAGVSARKPAAKRPELQRLLADVRAGKGDLIIFTKLDRWFRNISEYYKVQEVLEQHHVDWKTIQEDYDTTTASGRLKVNIMLSVAQDEADRTSERIKAVFETKRQRREPLSGNTPTGYKLDGKKLVKDPETEKAVSAFFKKYLACGSVSLAQQEALENGKRIEYQLASKMLDSPVYYGFYYDIDGMAPPYITEREFEKIQSMRCRTVRKTAKNRVYIFSGLIVCGECGSRSGGRTQTKSKTSSYNCPGHYIKRSGCENNANISERKIERYLLDTITAKMTAYKLEAEKLAAEREKKDYKAIIDGLKAKKKRMTSLYLNDLISMDECKAGCAEYDQKIEELEREAKNMEVPNFDSADEILKGGWMEDYKELSKEDRREFWRMLIKEIRIFRDRHIEYDIVGYFL